ncbi:hypothetical protein LOTGIDRAFT_153956 [Lottia gigantea]|uniref:Uncharacterized protein n=1 Tax=Lottia gigantea TaxID=225164 RepID=V4BRK0_LOTGI|nr:hypothetical protein LOTGIDRAFT_153956 [Lottia gigantea]ESO91514.1 hypothetical protein LOTGIDRAFT_153956 [Lottia gigantea]
MAEYRLHLIKKYFLTGMKQGEILQSLSERNGINLSRRQLQNIMYAENLYKRRNWADIMTVVEFIMEEHIGSGSLHGYRWMYQKLKQNGLKSRKEEVRLLMSILDPEGDELDSVTEVWDNHIIRPTTNQHVPSGRPIVMFSAPELYNVQDYKTLIENNQILICREETMFRKAIPCDEDIYDICMLLMIENAMQYPTDAYKALDLYLELRETILEILR